MEEKMELRILSPSEFIDHIDCNWDEIKAKFGELGASLQEVGARISEGVETFFATALQKITAFGEILLETREWWCEGVREFWGEVGLVFQLGVEQLSEIWLAIQTGLSTAWQWIAQGFTEFFAGVGIIWSQMMALAQQVFETIRNVIVTSAQAAWTFLTTAFESGGRHSLRVEMISALERGEEIE